MLIRAIIFATVAGSALCFWLNSLAHAAGAW